MLLYKYVPYERIDILKNNLIRFTQPAALDDPSEMRVQIKKMIDESTLTQMIDSETKKAIQPNIMIDNFRTFLKDELNLNFSKKETLKLYKYILDNHLEEFSSNMSEAISFIETFMKAIEPHLIDNFPQMVNEQFGVLSLSETASDIQMWSNYAKNHTGFVIIFNGNHSFFTSPSGKETDARGLHQVNYTDKIPTSELLIEDMTWDKLFFTKGKAWANQKEWRMVNALKVADKVIQQKGENIYLFKIPFRAINGVILGCRMSHKNRDNIIELISQNYRYHNAMVKEAKLNNEEYKIDIVELN